MGEAAQLDPIKPMLHDESAPGIERVETEI
jgi:hypothetical protein